jgi:apolipoprotein N-acyltransferase
MTRTTRRVAETGVSMAIGPEGETDAVIKLNAERIILNVLTDCLA